jgi:four helix bundle protein
MDKIELEERLIDFAVLIVEIVNEITESKAGNHLAGQLVRSGTSPALNYGEAQSGESRKDFILKMKIALKELKETYVNLRIIKKSGLCSSKIKIDSALKENNELISIFVKSVNTALGNMKK